MYHKGKRMVEAFSQLLHLLKHILAKRLRSLGQFFSVGFAFARVEAFFKESLDITKLSNKLFSVIPTFYKKSSRAFNPD